jgi:hypothetical protein
LFVHFGGCLFIQQANQLLKLREAPLVTESLSSLEKVVPRPKDDEQAAESGTTYNIQHCFYIVIDQYDAISFIKIIMMKMMLMMKMITV